jgi:predicted MFS family arabinose efflux permease
LLLTTAGIAGILTAVLGFPFLAKRYGDNVALQYVLILFLPIYVAFPFTALLQTSIIQDFVLGIFLLVKVGLSVIALQSCLTLLTNTAGENLSNAHAVNFALASISRGVGSLTTGYLFSLGIKLNFIMLPYLILGIWALITLFVRCLTLTNDGSIRMK